MQTVEQLTEKKSNISYWAIVRLILVVAWGVFLYMDMELPTFTRTEFLLSVVVGLQIVNFKGE